MSAADTGTMEDWDARNKLLEEEERLRLTAAKAKALVASPKVLLAHDYILDVPPGEGGLIPTEEGGSKTCDRCGADYIVHGNLSDVRLYTTEAAARRCFTLTVLSVLLLLGRKSRVQASLGKSGGVEQRSASKATLTDERRRGS